MTFGLAPKKVALKLEHREKNSSGAAAGRFESDSAVVNAGLRRTYYTKIGPGRNGKRQIKWGANLRSPFSSVVLVLIRDGYSIQNRYTVTYGNPVAHSH
jgi:hypothetical protein